MPTFAIRQFMGWGILLAALVSGGCASKSTTPNTGSAAQDQEFARLVSWMTGSFSSAAQSERDDQYFDIRLQMVRIWPDRDPGEAWLYVEQATAAAIDRPYRQRVYRVTRIDENRFRSEVYELLQPALQYAGWWKTPQRFSEFRPADLTELEGCAVTLRYDELSGSFVGSTDSGTCASTLRGAAYVMSEVTITPDMLLTWDRGYNAQDQQVWGATEGGYEFVRID